MIFVLFSFALLCGPPTLALWMLLSRLRLARSDRQWLYLLLCAATLLVLLFNCLVSLGILSPLRGLAPALIADNPGTSALLSAWGAAGICVILAIVAPRKRRASHI